MTIKKMIKDNKSERFELEKFHFEVFCGKHRGRAYFWDIIGISSFSQNSVVILTKRGRLKIIGESLSITVLENHSVEICGNIKKVIIGKEGDGDRNDEA